MKKKENNNDLLVNVNKEEKTGTQNYPLYPDNQDVYNKFKEEKEVDPEDISQDKVSDENDEAEELSEIDFNIDLVGSDLDVPGSELDDDQEKIGNEDEENNYYSLGGDEHNDLDEDKGE